MFRKNWLKLSSYISVLIVGTCLYIMSGNLNPRLESLFINIAATFYAVPLLYLFYEVIKYNSNKKLNIALYNYANKQVHNEMLNIIMQLKRTIIIIEDSSKNKNNDFTSWNKDEVEKYIKNNKYLGFQILRHWKISLENLKELLQNPFILDVLEDSQVISIINVLNVVDKLDVIRTIKDLHVATGEETKKYKVVDGIEINPENKDLPDRYLLLEHFKDDGFVVRDFGDIEKFNVAKCLKYYKINTNFLDIYSNAIYDILSVTKKCLNKTGLNLVENKEK